MHYERNLQVRLQQWYARLLKAHYMSHSQDVTHFQAFIEGSAPLRSIVRSIERSEPDLDPAAWVEGHFNLRGHQWPPTYAGKIKVCWWYVGQWAAGTPAYSTYGTFTTENDATAITLAATEALIDPLVDYLHDMIGANSDVLYLLERYRRRVEWFERDRLLAEIAAHPGKAEAVCDQDLRRFLFEQGIDYPFSQPASPSGQADVVGQLDGDDHLVCELKLFDGQQYGASYVAQGLGQAVRYSNDYGKPTAYLVVDNIGSKPLDVVGDGTGFPVAVVGNVQVFVVPIQMTNLESASRSLKTGRYQLKISELVSLVTRAEQEQTVET